VGHQPGRTPDCQQLQQAVELWQPGLATSLRRGLNRLHNFDPIPTVWRHESEQPGDMIRLDALESR
jgi:hypothetical protein